MNDRELLELAAKAVNAGCWHPLTHDPIHGGAWNPLDDDGDALRLAVKLNMDFTLSGKHAAVAQSSHAMAQEYCNGDSYAATRRAIVRAAAKVGESLTTRIDATTAPG